MRTITVIKVAVAVGIPMPLTTMLLTIARVRRNLVGQRACETTAALGLSAASCGGKSCGGCRTASTAAPGGTAANNVGKRRAQPSDLATAHGACHAERVNGNAKELPHNSDSAELRARSARDVVDASSGRPRTAALFHATFRCAAPGAVSLAAPGRAWPR